MRKNYLIIAFIFTIAITRAQTTLTTALDFTVTDIDGNSYNLYSILNSGKYVCLDFFFTTCGPCQSTCPYYKETFTNYGCNSQDVFFLSIDYGDSNADVEAYETTYLGGDAGYPSVSGTEGGGNAVCSDYNPGGFPTYILIAPNKQIIENDMWPINNAATFTTFFNSHGLTQKSCTTAGIAKQNSFEKLSVYPNPAINSLIVESPNSDKLSHIKVYDVLGNVLINEPLDKEKRFELDVSLYERGVYFAEIATESNTTIKKFNKQ